MIADNRSCLRDQQTTTATIDRVVDGDTVVLRDGRKVRIIGVNTLEINASHEPDQKWAKAATNAVQKLTGSQSVTLTIGTDRTDRYGRLLAHIQAADGTDIGSSLIKQGLALAITVGRNRLCANHNIRLEQSARAQRLGIWKQHGSWFLSAGELIGDERGFHVVRDQVDTILGHGRKTRLVLNNGLIIRFANNQGDQNNRDRHWLESLRGRTIEVRGWLSGKTGKVELTLYHPSSLLLLPD